MSTSNDLNAINLKAALWQTLRKVQSGKMTPASGDVVAAQAREILRTVRTQLAVFSQAGEGVSDEIVQFAKPGARRHHAKVAVIQPKKHRDAVR